ncbi:YadA family autotransporter adhesin [Variovorax sp. KK3]|uniref:YadA family autotransporter adhesin n=1 Tax=Variovorax sp. KK3 TaxID=1855728 RepID=UPI0015C3C816|nr:YadA-like family protein [Variovorax sp. KK3]
MRGTSSPGRHKRADGLHKIHPFVLLLGLSLGLCSQQVQSQTSRAAPPKSPAAAPPKTTPSTQQTTSRDAATCAQQLDNRSIALQRDINKLNSDLLIAQGVAVALDIAALGTEASIVLAPLGISLQIGAAGANATAIGLAIAGQDKPVELTDLDERARNLPGCDQAFAGTVTVETGGVNVTGGSIFNSDLAVNAKLDVAGTTSTNALDAAQGITAMNGELRLGNRDGQSSALGITLGGGAVAGLGGSAQQVARTGHVNAIAIGNGSAADTATSIALGSDAQATAQRTTALGSASRASMDGATAVGAASQASATDATALGTSAGASGNGATAVGFASQARALDTVVGYRASASADGAFAGGAYAAVASPGSVAIGMQSIVATGSPAAIAIGMQARVAQSASSSIAIGANAQALAPGAVALGADAVAAAPSSVALGHGSVAVRNNTVSIGSVGNERQLSNVAPGMAGTDAVNLDQLEAVKTGAAREVDQVRQRVERVAADAYRGVAMTAALAEGPPDLKPGETAAFAGVGSYKGYGAVAVGLVHAAANARLRYSVGVGTTGKDAVVRAGLSYKFNSKD